MNEASHQWLQCTSFPLSPLSQHPTCTLFTHPGTPFKYSVLLWSTAKRCDLLWLHWAGHLWDESICLHAAEGGHLEVLKWARANGCPWDKLTHALATSEDHLEVLQWAQANGCPS
jgi:hypothetical protein